MKRSPVALVTVLLAAACTSCAPPPALSNVAIDRAPGAAAASPPARAVAASAREILAERVRDERRYAPRATALLIVEIQSLEQLFAATPATSLDRPRMMRRLAEEYVELARVLEREPGAASRTRGPPRSVHAARHAAIDDYARLVREHPQWCTAPDAVAPAKSTGCADEVLYALALEAERDADLVRARHTYLDLLQGWPNSRFVPLAYLAFGELFMVEARDDPAKLPLAEQSYAEVTKYPPEENRAWGYAELRLAEVHALQHDDQRALTCLIKAAQWATAHGDANGIGGEARREAVIVYARAGDPAKARERFAELASSAEELEEMMAALERLHGG